VDLLDLTIVREEVVQVILLCLLCAKGWGLFLANRAK
jgi:hypothetical protein